MFSSARFAQIGLLAVIAVFGSCMAVLGRASYSNSKPAVNNPVPLVVEEIQSGTTIVALGKTMEENN